MQRPMKVAMLISVVLHGAGLAIVSWLISNQAEPSISTTFLNVSIQPSTIREDNAAEQRPDDNVAAPEISTAANHSVPVPVAATSPPIAAANVVTDREQPDVQGSAAAAAIDVVTTTSRNELNIAVVDRQTDDPAITEVGLSPNQEEMLARKFEEWADDADQLPDENADLTWNYNGQEYLARFMILNAEDDMGIQQITVEVSTEEDGKRLSTEMRMKRLAFSNYAQFVNRWDPDVQLQHDVFEGRFHSNSEINLAYDRKVTPQFHGEVTTSARKVNIIGRPGRVQRDQIFLGGLQTGVKTIGWPKDIFPLANEASVADDQVHRFDADARLTFHADGSYDWQLIGADSLPQTAQISGNTSYLIAADNVSLYVKGTVNGKVLVYSPKRIVIEDDLVYARHPAETADADDFLGLVSDKYIEIAPAEVTGPGDLAINAAIYAKRRFAVRDYNSRPRALLSIYGSLSAGSLSATEPRFNTSIQFDHRLETQRPPGFPMTSRYVVESWDSSWKVESNELLH